ncbi:MAG: ribonuclease III [Bdellovibrionaceae bacterium]|nr:ribonuclease III [Pseudobdellovibrionaceae bacterium]
MEFISTLSQRLGIALQESPLYEQAMTHKSVSKDSAETLNNERLEYLGDAVIGLVVADILYKFFPLDDEGNLSRKRASLVNETTLSKVAAHFGLQDFLRVHHSQSLEDFKSNARITASLFEALVGALYLEIGFMETFQWLHHVYENVVTVSFSEHDFSSDYKTRFQEKIQSQFKVTPRYETTEVSGPDHQRLFTVTVTVNGVVYGTGQGLSKKNAAQEAAKMALERMDGNE